MKNTLIIDPAMGMAGDMFSAALIGLGAPADAILGVMTRTARLLGEAEIHVECIPTPEGDGYRLKVHLAANDHVLPESRARKLLEQAIEAEGLAKPYAEFARRALAILIDAEREAHSSGRLDFGAMYVQAIGVAHTPYHHTHEEHDHAHSHPHAHLHTHHHHDHHHPDAPYQPGVDTEGEFFIEVFPEFATGLAEIDTFSHVFVLSWMHHSTGYALQVTPPWQQGEKKWVGLFASRSPNRPNPIGLTLTEVRGVEGNRLMTGPLDLFDGTPIIDIKPHVRSLDQTGVGDDGWLAETNHLELHRRGIPHSHAGEEAMLHEAQDILLDVMGAATGLQQLGVDMSTVTCLIPVAVGGGVINFSHGILPAPAPATIAILKHHRIPHVAGPVDVELLTPTGAAILAALHPLWRCREPLPEARVLARGMGLGTKNLRPLNALRLALMS